MASDSKELFTVKKNEKVGRYAVASENLKAGDIIFSETPFAYGPKSDSPPLCLGCFAPVDCTVLCSKCGWPVCGSICENLQTHKEYECQVFSSSKVKFQPVEDPSAVCLQYECITPLRVLLEKEKNPERWAKEIEPMEAHNDKRKDKPIWEFNKINVVDYIRGPLKLEKFSEDLIHTVCGILEINAFEGRATSGYLIRCLFPKLAILSHNCVSNITHSIECLGTGDKNDFSVTVCAAIAVNKDEELFSSYTYSLWPTLVRREFLKEGKYFDCTCKRCADKTELGTHMSTLKCSKCDNGVLMSNNPLDAEADWNCTHCEFKTSGRAVRKVFATIQEEIDAVEYVTGDEGIEQRETIFKKYRSVLHPKHAYMTILRVSLSQLYGKSGDYAMEWLPDLILERKVELCQTLLDVLDVVEPGYNRLRGITLYELHAPLMILAKNLYSNDCIKKNDFKKKLQEAIDILGKSVDILKIEPATSLEGQLYQVASQAYEGLKQNFDMLVETAQE